MNSLWNSPTLYLWPWNKNKRKKSKTDIDKNELENILSRQNSISQEEITNPDVFVQSEVVQDIENFDIIKSNQYQQNFKRNSLIHSKRLDSSVSPNLCPLPVTPDLVSCQSLPIKAISPRLVSPNLVSPKSLPLKSTSPRQVTRSYTEANPDDDNRIPDFLINISTRRSTLLLLKEKSNERKRQFTNFKSKIT